MFALLLLIDASIKTIIASSSDAKIAQIEKLSHQTTSVNYTTHPDTSVKVKRVINDQVFTFDEAKDAFDHMIAKRHAEMIITKVAE
ncbi:hypothetical protein TASIC1_0010035300 [Trichoderma asperellum]|uniref:Uncharacterized protein n=1 Tax=Trichoderma asperellum TaxID=101201 RepID=A0A6V8R2N2_TRIAP|nr:hypothetical protein TASIC1_0010035300 [Trichoderma asperellum]